MNNLKQFDKGGHGGDFGVFDKGGHFGVFAVKLYIVKEDNGKRLPAPL